MKKDTEKKTGPNQRNVLAANADDAAIEWFNQFDNQPGIHDTYSPEELNRLKEKMLVTIKNKINEQD